MPSDLVACMEVYLRLHYSHTYVPKAYYHMALVVCFPCYMIAKNIT